MTPRLASLARPLCAACVLLAAAAPALANANHPALQARARPAAIDTNTFIVGHPASPTNGAAPRAAANGHHPAVLVHARVRGIDTNTFLVGHPAGGTPGASAAQPEQQARLGR